MCYILYTVYYINSVCCKPCYVDCVLKSKLYLPMFVHVYVCTHTPTLMYSKVSTFSLKALCYISTILLNYPKFAI